MLFRVAPDIDAFIKLSSNAPSRTPFDAPNSILTALIVLRDFGSHALEIIEGRKTTEQDAQQTSQTNNVDNKLGDNKDKSTISAVNILLAFAHIICSQTHNNFINHAVCIF
jgi:hypothetical protein